MFRLKASVLLVAAAALCGAAALPRAASGRVQEVNFSSVYTDLKKECKDAFKLEKGEELQSDMPLRCKGYGGYEVHIGYSAASSHLVVQPSGDKTDEGISLGPQPMDYDQTRKIEWRLADGKPFAVIYRVDLTKGVEPETMWTPENKTGESLTVKGLKGYEHISFEVDASTPNANAKARELADEAYLNGR